ncbi:CDP-alcohol phosphatidyltransferase family protein [Eubacteriales bacterium OttesenSCG-928-M02]|nr:CDP-alcohol phosphatidyltransferase family protein [Eubacteriales bacterium OttesenSCG-928-M02]
MGDFKKQIPNILTTVRLLLIPVFVWAFWHPDTVFPGQGLAFAISVTAAVTDYVDGYLARRFEAISTYGKLFDPVADKLMTIAIVVCFMLEGTIPTLYVALLLGKDVVLMTGAGIMALCKIVVSADIFGKIATVIIAIGLAMTFFAVTQPWNMVVLYIGLGVGFIAFFRYFYYGLKAMKARKKD